jgi:hypothetical protein
MTSARTATARQEIARPIVECSVVTLVSITPCYAYVLTDILLLLLASPISYIVQLRDRALTSVR